MPLSDHYSRFRVTARTLLTGHSHQAWPDIAFIAQQRAWLDAAEFVDDKWARADAQAHLVKEGFARLLGDEARNIALGQNTHELIARWLSALLLRERRRIITTDAEFHSIRRLVDRLAEEGFDVVTIPAAPIADVAARMAAAVDDRAACVLISSVLFETAEIVPDVALVARTCRRHGAALLVDAYHHLNVVPFDLHAMDLADAYVTGGGYKYCQLGEGNCFLRVPPGTHLHPLLTGWFAKDDGTEADAFAGATYDPTSHYRGAAVFAFHQEQQLTADRLRAINVGQVARLEQAIDALDLDPAVAAIHRVAPERRGGFLAIRSPRAERLVTALRDRGVFADARGGMLRLGPAPYVSDDQLRDAAVALGDCVRAR